MKLSFTKITTNLARFLKRFHAVIFVVIVFGGLSIVVLLLHNVVITSSESGDYKSISNNANFDQATIDRIKKLRTSDEADSQIDLSRGRTNPFVE